MNDVVELEIGGKLRYFYIGHVEVNYLTTERDPVTLTLHRSGEKYIVTLVEI